MFIIIHNFSRANFLEISLWHSLGLRKNYLTLGNKFFSRKSNAGMAVVYHFTSQGLFKFVGEHTCVWFHTFTGIVKKIFKLPITNKVNLSFLLLLKFSSISWHLTNSSTIPFSCLKTYYIKSIWIIYKNVHNKDYVMEIIFSICHISLVFRSPAIVYLNFKGVQFF